ncbi:hypothetical protein BOVATA_045090 [Babesia ovata]|uniref:Uncharacterized protein n=1 Tax=Babesia ovata TaxID=189622 RepID=A0A2H6KJ57_9APIC|nr:uncharacterized protein BOVATA_045090 [Babesia ovata]GBE63016.1 hypothetical protein BOVATA_045090 [Babesia ovata]
MSEAIKVKEAAREVGGQGEGSEGAKEGDEGGRWVEVRRFGGGGGKWKMRIWVKDADGGGDGGGGSEATSERGGTFSGRFGGISEKVKLGQRGSEAAREVGGQGEGGEGAKEGDEGGRWVEVRRFRRWREKVENEDLGEGRRRRR